MIAADVSKYRWTTSPSAVTSGRKEGGDPAVEVRHRGAQRDQGVHVGGTVPGDDPRAAVEARADVELDRRGEEELQQRRVEGRKRQAAVPREHLPMGEQEEGNAQDDADAQPRQEGPLLLPLHPLLPGDRVLPRRHVRDRIPRPLDRGPEVAPRRPPRGRYSTLAVCAARLTDAATTPGTFRSARSTRPTHDAHVIPATGSVTRARSSPVRASCPIPLCGSPLEAAPGTGRPSSFGEFSFMIR